MHPDRQPERLALRRELPPRPAVVAATPCLRDPDERRSTTRAA